MSAPAAAMTSLVAAVLASSDLEQAEAVRLESTRAGVDPLAFCVSQYSIPEELAYERACRWAGLRFSSRVPAEVSLAVQGADLDEICAATQLKVRCCDQHVVLMAPDADRLVALAQTKQRPLGQSEAMLAVPPRALRSWLRARLSPRLTDSARRRLANTWPFASAHLDLSVLNRLIFGLILSAIVLLAVFGPFMGNYWMGLFAIGLVLFPAIVRLAAISTLKPPPVPGLTGLGSAELPVYSVLVPLRDEANMVPQLVRALMALDYPRERLDIKILVEAHCIETRRALSRHAPDWFEIIAVPDSRPRTKPKALNYALPLLRGSFVVVFDAEDRPAPDQLRRAVRAFAERPNLGCMQAQLVVDNGYSGPLASQFAGEYAALFGIVLPALARWGLPMPLGGTSNHFRVEVLRGIGGWDSFNVTEDADIGLRLARGGFEVGTLDSATYEAAPRSLKVWMKQRTRWLKGWMVTYVVHTRRPLRLVADLGWRRFVFFQAFLLSMIAAPLLHLAFLIALIGQFAIDSTGDLPPLDQALTYLIVFVIGNFAAFIVNAAGLARLGERPLIILQLLLPIYWILIALATVRAFLQLLRRPDFWEKTPHEPVAQAQQAHHPAWAKSVPAG